MVAARGRGGSPREGEGRARRGEIDEPRWGWSCSLERNYPLRDRDEAAGTLREGGEATKGEGGGVVFTRHGCCWCCAVVAPSARAPVPFFVYCCPIERTDEPVSKHARRSPRMVRRTLFFFLSFSLLFFVFFSVNRRSPVCHALRRLVTRAVVFVVVVVVVSLMCVYLGSKDEGKG